MTPASVVVTRTIPTSLPGAPPPSSIKEYVGIDIGNRINIGFRDHDNMRRRRKNDWRRQRNINANLYLRHDHSRQENHKRKKNYF